MPLAGVGPYDDIVIGGGTAGAVVAARLSEDPARRVLLLEAGPDYPDDLPPALLDISAAVLSGHNWDWQAIVSEDAAAPRSAELTRIAQVFELAAARLGSTATLPIASSAGVASTRTAYPLARVVGGGSAINGGLAFLPRPEDSDAWVAAGNDLWGWDRLKPAIDRLTSAEPDKPSLPIETTTVASLAPCQAAFLDACLATGMATVDLRQGRVGGVGLLPKNSRGGQRMSMARLYLGAARHRSNLTLQAGCLVDRVIFDRPGGELAATGVDTRIAGVSRRFSGARVVLCAGAIGSPAILQRSGVGASRDLARAGIAPVLERAGVGQNLQDHPAVSIWAVPTAGSCRAGEVVHEVMLQQRSRDAEPRCDVQLFMLSGIWTPGFPALREVVGTDLAMGVSVVIATPRSRGSVQIVARDPETSPRILLNCLHDPIDLQRMRDGVRTAWTLMQHERLARHVDRVVLWSPGTIASDPLLTRMIRSTVRTVWHPAGTLRMGREDDPSAVVDQHGRLYGCRNVSVADAAILPTLPSVPPNLTCALIGERIAASLTA